MNKNAGQLSVHYIAFYITMHRETGASCLSLYFGYVTSLSPVDCVYTTYLLHYCDQWTSLFCTVTC